MNLSLVKTATDEHADRLLEREARWLRELEAVPQLEGQVPRLLKEGTASGGRRYLVLSVAPGKSETRAFTVDHARFLARLGKARFRAADFEDSGCCQGLSRALRGLEGGAEPATLAALEDAYHDCETALLYWTGPYVLSQGDFAPWNIRMLRGQLFVSEWGQARFEASPLDDVLHYLMIQHALSPRPMSARELQAAMRSAGEFARQAYPEWTWRPQVIGALTLVYLLGAILRLAEPRSSRYWKLVEKRSAWLPA